jgi:hypothetical protein
MGLAQTYRNVTSTFHHNHLGYQPLFPLGSIAQVVQTKSSRSTRRLLLASFIIVITFALSLFVSHTRSVFVVASFKVSVC